MPSLPRIGLAILCIAATFAPLQVRAADWPMWRYDAQRAAASPQQLPSRLHLQWTLELPRLKPAWPDQPKMQLDSAYEPVVVGHALIVGSSHDDSVAAYSTSTGELLWRFFTEGPVRFAPAAWQDKLLVASDDGYLYCLEAATGRLAWKFRGGPSDRKILGNERLISIWPARGAPTVVDDTVYFAAGIWPFMGIFLHAVDIQTGEAVWTNDGDGSTYMKQPHNTDSFAGVAPQGPLVAIGNRLLIPGGRSVPACYDRLSGKLLYYLLAENGKKGGGSAVSAVGNVFFNGGSAFHIDTEKYLADVGELTAATNDVLYAARDGKLRALDLKAAEIKVLEMLDRKGAKFTAGKWTIRELELVETPKLTSLIKAGDRLYAGASNQVLALKLPLPDDEESLVVWQDEVRGTPTSLAAADDRLFVSTLEGRIYCYGAEETTRGQPVVHKYESTAAPIADVWTEKAAGLLKATGAQRGYCLAWGVGSGRLIAELARQSELHIVAIEPDADRAQVARQQLLDAGITASRVAVVVAEFDRVELPPYLASLVVAEESDVVAQLAKSNLLPKLFNSLRPYGGAAYLPVAADSKQALRSAIDAASLANARVRDGEESLWLTREGALPGSANWTHEHADAANTRVSLDSLVKAPLGLLWFGGTSNEGVLPRHGHGPQPQVVDGRLFIEGVDMIRAVDIYTGRLMWEAKLPGVGKYYDNTAHQPGANAAGTNYIATPDGIYVAYGQVCLRLDPATGQRLSEFKLPGVEGSNDTPTWGYINVFEDYLIAGAEPLFDPTLAKTPPKTTKTDDDDDDKEKKPKSTTGTGTAADLITDLVAKVLKIDNDNFSASNRLLALDRHTGKVLWSATAQSGGFRHNAICIGGGRVYCIDRLSGAQVSRLKRRGEESPHKPRLLALDLQTGQPLWSTEENVFGTWLSYSAERDVLVEAGRSARDTLLDEPKGMRAYAAAEGRVLWDNKSHSGPAMLHGEQILMAGTACDLMSGAATLRDDPLTGERVPWVWSRNYGCNTPAASQHLLTFRSGAAGYFDFCNDGGTGNFGGFRSSCTNNLIVAGGVLSAPDYTRTCTCSYQNQTSLALIHMPEAEMWTAFGSQPPKTTVRRLGLNLGAPGDRRDERGTLWLEFPSVGGLSPAVDATIEPAEVRWFRRHTSQVAAGELPWVAGSGAEGLESLTISLDKKAERTRPYTVRLHFMEPDDTSPGERVFDVALQGQRVLASLDIVKEAGGRQRGLIKEFKAVAVKDELTLTFTPSAAGSTRRPVLSGIELHAEGW